MTDEQPFFCLHTEFEADYPGQREYALMREQDRRARHVYVNGSDEGYMPGRLFPCPGGLYRLEPGSRIVICSGCQFEVSLPVDGASVRRPIDEETW